MNDESWKGEHLIRAKKFDAEAVMSREELDAKMRARRNERIEALTQARKDGLSLTAAAKRLKISLSTAWKLNQTYQIGFPERSWKKRRKGLIA